MLIDILRFEWRYHTRQVTFIAASLLFFLLGFTLTATTFGPENLFINSPYNIVLSLGTLSLISVFVIAVFSANAVVRDRENKMEEIVFTTAVEKGQYLFGRFIGSFLAAVSAFSWSILGMISALALPSLDPARIAPLQFGHYLWALLVMVLPSMFFVAAVLFGIAALTRSMLASVVGSVVIYLLYNVAAALTNSPLMAQSKPGAPAIPGVALGDPFGLSAFFEQQRHWSALQRNTHLVSLSGTFLLNRLIWIGLSFIVLYFIHRRFSFRLLQEAKKRKLETQTELIEVESTYRPVEVTLDGSLDRRSFWSATRLEIRSFLRNIPFLLLTLLWTVLGGMEMLSDVANAEYGASIYPTTGILLNAIQQPFTLIATILLIYYSAEIVWRERQVEMAEMINATPPSSAVFVFSKWVALCVMLLVQLVASYLFAIGVQLSKGYFHFEPGVAIAYTFFALAPFVAVAMAAVLIQTIAPQKYAGLVVVALVALFSRLGGMMGVDHPLLRFGYAPPIVHSSMNGFGHFTAPFLWFLLLWLLLGSILLLAATALWRRAGAQSIFAALRRATSGTRRTAILFAFLAAGVAALIFYNTNIRNAYRTGSSVTDWQAGYEKKYRALSATAQPHVVGLRGSAEMFPRERRYRVMGEYVLRNDTSAPISEVMVNVRREGHLHKLSLAGAKSAETDGRFAVTRFQLARPLAPHETTQLQFEVDFDFSAFPAGSPDNSIVGNGSYILNSRCFPTIGYRQSYEIKEPSERKKRGLPVLTTTESETEIEGGDDWIDFDLTVSTEGDQTVVLPGHLERQWSEGGRNYFHYVSTKPMHALFALVSGRYEKETARVDDIEVSLYFDAKHRSNAARTLKAATDSLRYFQKAFGPYPHGRELRLVETAVYSPFAGYAEPGVICLNENRSLLIDARDPNRLDLITRRVAHEVAHQWWGHFVSPRPGPGATTIVESLAKYGELALLEQTQGASAVRRSLAIESDLYLCERPEAQREEAPLTSQLNESYLYYRKGSIVMHGLRDLLGEERMNRALGMFAQSEGGPARQPTTNALLQRLHGVAATAEEHLLIDQWMGQIVLYDFALKGAVAKPLSDGRYEVTLEVSASKSALGKDDRETKLPLDESIEIGIYSTEPDFAEGSDQILHLQKHRLHQGKNELKVIVTGEPQVVAIDPYFTRVSRTPMEQSGRIDF